MTTMASPSVNIHMVDILEEELVDYEGSGGEELMKLSSEDDDAWDPAADTLQHMTRESSTTSRLKILRSSMLWRLTLLFARSKVKQLYFLFE